MGRLDNRVALITGGARGQGAAEGKLFADEGAKVVLTDVLDADGAETATAIGGSYLHHDVKDEEAWRRVVAEVREQHGRLDILINNAGIFISSPLMEMDLDDYRRLIDVNQVGVFLGMKHAGPAMVETSEAGGSPAIVNISSIAGM
ncbi:MAG TPA: SDR family NAD(P)-dependent oxidoreductase, partial [Dehalococcoidia bacterium]|nr:SDR family NAD(P)-dependent oxidoreductase [Dehalococcoidia bacterium]